MAELSYRDAVARGIAQELARDDRVVLLGEDVAAAGGVFKATVGLYEQLGQRGPRLPDLGAGHYRCGDGAAMKDAADSRINVQRLPWRLLGHGRQRGGEDQVHDQRSGEAPDGNSDGKWRRKPVWSSALTEPGELGDGGPGAKGRRSVKSC